MSDPVDSITTQADLRACLRKIRLDTLDALSAAEQNVFQPRRTAAQSVALITLRALKESAENAMGALLWLADE